MGPKLSLAALLLLAASAPALAAGEPRVIGTDFVVWIAQKDGTEISRSTTTVPYLPGRACFGWTVEIENAPDFLALRETLQLPGPAGSWGAPGSTVSPDSTAAKTDRILTPDDGRVGSRWCLVEGDPLGPHRIDISVKDWLRESFEFEVVAP